jgi:hypothetical protein
MKPNHEKKNTRPWTLVIGLSKGIDRALLLMGLTSGCVHISFGLKPTILNLNGRCDVLLLLKLIVKCENSVTPCRNGSQKEGKVNVQ